MAAHQQVHVQASNKQTAAREHPADQARPSHGKHASVHKSLRPASLGSLLSRLDLITSTLAVLEERLSATEARFWPGSTGGANAHTTP